MLLFFLVLVPTVALAQTAPVCVPTSGNAGILTGFANQFSTTTAAWTTTALRYAEGLFFALVGIEIAWSAITYVLQKDSLPDFVAALLLKILSVSFFFILLQPQYGPVWIADVVASFMQAGSAIGGQPQFSTSDPSSVFNCGTNVANAMLQSVSHNNVGITLWNILPAAEAVFAALVCALGVVLAFAIIAGQLLITLIESYIVIGAGVFMLGFTGSRWTLVFGEKYVGYAFSVGIKLFMLELIVGLGYSLGQQWAALFGNGIAPPETYIEVVGAALIFGFVSWQIPGLAASLMNGAPRMTLGSFLNTAGAVAVGGVVVGSGVGGMLAAGRSPSIGSTETQRAASVDTRGLDAATSVYGNGRSSGGVPGDAERHAWRTSDAFASRTPSEDNSASTIADADASETETASKSSETDSSPGPAPEADVSADAEVTAEEAAETRASDAAVADADARAARQAEQRDVQTPPSSAVPGGNLAQSLRQPPIPDDSADGNIHIRFKHPE